MPPLRTSRICSPSSSACTTAAHSLYAGARSAEVVTRPRIMVPTEGVSVEERIEVDGLKLAVHIARPATNSAVPAVVLCHDFPTPPRGSLASGLTFPEL